jgi:hypothetical protein
MTRESARTVALRRTHCIFGCGTPLTDATRAPHRCPHVPRGEVASHRSWCRGCDAPDAPARARRLRAAEDRARRRDARAAWRQAYEQRPEVKARERARQRRKAWRAGRTTFRCAHCGGRFPRQREAYRVEAGHRVKLGVCSHCRVALIGPNRQGRTKLDAAAYHRAYRAQRKAMTSPERRAA